MLNFTYLEKIDDLSSYCQQLQSTAYLSLDTEFIREDTYYPKLALIQISAEGNSAIIDTSSIDDLSPLFALLTNPKIEKIMHDPEQDIEILFSYADDVPNPIYDTQLAAAFLGYEKQISYKNLLNEVLNVQISKSQTRSSWLQRPLTDSQLQYAIEDVYYLNLLHNEFDRYLYNTYKQSWFIEESDTQKLKPSSYWNKISNKTHMPDHASTARLKQLIEWREEIAKKIDRPRQWTVPDACLIYLAKQTDIEKGLGHTVCKHANQYARQLIQLWSVKPSLKLESFNRRLPPLNSHQQSRLKSLQKMVQNTASEHNLAPALLTSKKQLVTLARSQQPPFFTGWRAEAMEQQAVDILC